MLINNRFARIYILLIMHFVFLKVLSQDFWEMINPGIDSTFSRCMEVSTEDDIYLGMNGFNYPGGIYRSCDNALTWQYLGLTELPVYTIEVCTNGNIIAGVYDGMYKSTDNGNSWYEVYHEIVNVSCIKSLSNGYVFAGGGGNLHGILRSSDFGESWDTCHVFTNYGQETLKSLAFSDEGHVLAGTFNFFGEGSIMYSTDLGNTWNELETPEVIGWPWIYSLAFHPQGDLFAGLYGKGLFRYNFTTEEWTTIYAQGISPDDILFIGDNKIFIAVENHPNFFGGVLYSNDNGQTFEWVNEGLYGGGIETSINRLFYSSDKHVYAHGLGIYISLNSVLTKLDNQIILANNFLSNFPNPFKEKTTIVWENSIKDNDVLLIITNINGKIVLNRTVRNTGGYVFHNNILETGIYFYSIVGNKKTLSGKMVLVK